MEIKHFLNKIANVIQKYRYGILVLFLGIALMTIPGKDTEDRRAEPLVEQVPIVSVESKLSDILSTVAGAGKTTVFLTEAAGEEMIYQTDDQIRSDSETAETKTETITVTDRNKDTTGLVRQVIPAQYLGAIVVCQGAENPAVKLAIVDAVSKVTGLGADRISVLKMK